jgi:hypothetical protein
MAANLKGIESMLRNGSGRVSACFGAPDTNPTPPLPKKENEEAGMRLLDNFDWGGDTERSTE